MKLFNCFHSGKYTYIFHFFVFMCLLHTVGIGDSNPVTPVLSQGRLRDKNMTK